MARASGDGPWIVGLSVERRGMSAETASARRTTSDLGAVLVRGALELDWLRVGLGLGVGTLDVDQMFGALAGPAFVGRVAPRLLEAGVLSLGLELEARFVYLRGELGHQAVSGRIVQGHGYAVAWARLGSAEPWLAIGASRAQASIDLPAPVGAQTLVLATPWPVDVVGGLDLRMALPSLRLVVLATLAFVVPRPEDLRFAVGVAF